MPTAMLAYSQNSGTRCVLEYRRPAKDSWLAPVCLLSFCYHFATFCYQNATSPLLAINDQGTLAMYTSPRRKGAPSESRSSLRADSSTLNPTPLAINPSMPDGLANTSRQHSKLRTRSPFQVRRKILFFGVGFEFRLKPDARQPAA